MNPTDFDLSRKQSPIHGFGTFALKFIHKDSLICPFVGEKMSYQDFKAIYGNDWTSVYRRLLGANKLYAKTNATLFPTSMTESINSRNHTKIAY